jgi:hypothetical protein
VSEGEKERDNVRCRQARKAPQVKAYIEHCSSLSSPTYYQYAKQIQIKSQSGRKTFQKILMTIANSNWKSKTQTPKTKDKLAANLFLLSLAIASDFDWKDWM